MSKLVSLPENAKRYNLTFHLRDKKTVYPIVARSKDEAFIIGINTIHGSGCLATIELADIVEASDNDTKINYCPSCGADLTDLE